MSSKLAKECKTSEELLKMSLDVSRRRRTSRRFSKVTQEQIAQVLGVTISTVQRHERNNYQNLPLGQFIKLLEFLEINGIDTEM